MFKFSGTPADTTSNEFNDNFVRGMNNQKIQNTHRASIKAKVNQVLTDKPSTWAADKGKKRDIRHIVNTNQYYNTVKKQYNKNPKAGTDAAVAHADKVIPPVMEKRNSWFKGAYGGVPMAQDGDAYRIKNTTLDYQSEKGNSFSSRGSQKNLRTGVTLHDNLSESKTGVVTDNVVKIDPSSGNFVGELQTGKNISSIQGSGVLAAVKQVGKHNTRTKSGI
jgi:hypothetical protein